jgi:hypothetical protein
MYLSFPCPFSARDPVPPCLPLFLHPFAITPLVLCHVGKALLGFGALGKVKKVTLIANVTHRVQVTRQRQGEPGRTRSNLAWKVGLCFAILLILSSELRLRIVFQHL